MSQRPTSVRDRCEYSLTFTKSRYGTVLVEPHWTIAYPPFTDSVDMEAVWARTVPGRVLGVDVRHLDPHDLVLHLCLHVVHWRESAPLLWFHELDRLIRRDEPKIDWQTVVARARSSGLGVFVLEIARALAEACRTPIPDLASIPASDDPVRGAATEWSGGAMRRRAKLRYALSLLFPPSDYMRFRYGPCGRLRLAWRDGVRTWKLSGEGVRWLRALLAPVSSQ